MPIWTKILAGFVKACLWCLEPIKPIRFVRIFSSRIGHCSADMDLFLRRLQLRPTKAKLVFFALYSEPVANAALLKIWQDRVFVIHQGMLGWLWQAVFLELKKTKYVIELCPKGWEYKAWHVPSILKKPAPLLEVPHVLFHSRDPAYLASAQPGLDYSHNDFRDCSIENCIPAADFITGKGLVAVRVGKTVAKAVPSDNPHVFDYPFYHNDEHDLRLAANAYFYIGPNNGTAQLPLLYDTPVAYTNSIPLWMLNWGRGCLFIPKLFRPVGGGDFLSFSELEKLGLFDHAKRVGLSTKWYAERGLEPVENTAEDVLDLCKDMFDLIEQKPKAIELQRAYKERYFSGQEEREWGPNIGPRFAMKYQALLM